MGFFGKLFDKKECDICGGEIGMLGNRKLDDGNMCKACAAKLSPWFTDRKKSTVEQIKEQLAYRERNREELNNFRPTKTIGREDIMLIEERNGIPYRFAVAKTQDWRAENVDLFLFQDLVSCVSDIHDFRRELKYRDGDEERSYSPPRYEYNYDFFMDVTIRNHPYVDRFAFKLNNRQVEVISEGGGGLFGGSRHFNPTYHPQYQEYKSMCDEIERLVTLSRQNPVEEAPVQQAPAAAAAPQAAPAGPKFCPNCGAPAEGGKFCQHCGGPLG